MTKELIDCVCVSCLLFIVRRFPLISIGPAIVVWCAAPLRRDGFGWSILYWPLHIEYVYVYTHYTHTLYSPRLVICKEGRGRGSLQEREREREFIFSDGLFFSLFTTYMKVDVSETNPHNGIKREKKGYVPRCSPQHLSLSNRKSHVKRMESFSSSFSFFSSLNTKKEKKKKEKKRCFGWISCELATLKVRNTIQ
jgi:hypothetical protein